MDFSFTDEQTMLRDTVASYLADQYDFEKRRAVIRSEPGRRPEVWNAFANELGITSALAVRPQANAKDDGRLVRSVSAYLRTLTAPAVAPSAEQAIGSQRGRVTEARRTEVAR